MRYCLFFNGHRTSRAAIAALVFLLCIAPVFLLSSCKKGEIPQDVTDYAAAPTRDDVRQTTQIRSTSPPTTMPPVTLAPATRRPETTAKAAPPSAAPSTAAQTTAETTTQRKKLLDKIHGLFTETTQPEPTSHRSSSGDYAALDGSAMLGNSMAETVKAYGVAPNVDIYAKIGVDVKGVFTKTLSGSTVPIIDELKGKNYDRVFLMFGENELGWVYSSVFIEKYGNIIDAVHERLPNAKIYVQSIPPISASASEKNEDGANNARIAEYNELLRRLAYDKQVCFADVWAALADDGGNLPSTVSPDGIHLNKAYCRLWMECLCDAVENWE